MNSKLNKVCILIHPKNQQTQKRQKIAAFLAKPLKLRPALPNHDDDTPILVSLLAAPIASSVSGGAWIEGIHHEQRHHPQPPAACCRAQRACSQAGGSQSRPSCPSR
jgi:hypothetical protein